MNRVFCQQCQAFELRARYAREVELVTDPEAQLEQLGSQAVTAPWYECQVTAIDERRGQPMGRAAREAQPVGQVAECDRAFRDQLNDIQSAKQRLASQARRLRGCVAPRAHRLRPDWRCSSHYMVPVLVCGTTYAARNVVPGSNS